MLHLREWFDAHLLAMIIQYLVAEYFHEAFVLGMIEIPEVKAHMALYRTHSKSALAGSDHDLAGGAHQLFLVCGAQAV